LPAEHDKPGHDERGSGQGQEGDGVGAARGDEERSDQGEGDGKGETDGDDCIPSQLLPLAPVRAPSSARDSKLALTHRRRLEHG
jgi:hypothetical protein